MSGLWQRVSFDLKLKGARERIGELSILQEQTDGAVGQCRHGQDESKELISTLGPHSTTLTYPSKGLWLNGHERPHPALTELLREGR
jgi:hypothetical protein